MFTGLIKDFQPLEITKSDTCVELQSFHILCTSLNCESKIQKIIMHFKMPFNRL